MEKEIFKPVPNYEGRYEISNLGRLKSLKKKVRIGRGFRTIKESILKGSYNKDGYHQYGLNYKDKNLSNVYGAHQLVAMAFLNHLPNSSKGYVIHHIDRDVKNNNLKNLRIVSNRFNSVEYRDVASNLWGVNYYKGRYQSQVWHNKKLVYLGRFYTDTEAHKKSIEYANKNNIKRIFKG